MTQWYGKLVGGRKCAGRLSFANQDKTLGLSKSVADRASWTSCHYNTPDNASVLDDHVGAQIRPFVKLVQDQKRLALEATMHSAVSKAILKRLPTHPVV
jgi:hypothetical protein